MSLIIDWIVANWVELAAAILGLIGITLQIKQNSLYWLTSIIMVSLYIYVFFVSGFYADMSFQFYYLVVSIYGWYFWLTVKDKQQKSEIRTSRLNKNQWIYSILVSSAFYILIYLILYKFTDSEVAIGDAFTTSLSFVATWLLARRILENWLFWIVIDAVSTGLYIYKGLYPTAILFTVLTILAVVGYIKWKKSLDLDADKA
ncbi:MAG: nicotinamide riboside transporter PnuC [Marinilabiliales bacterium]|nr:MAG: nicotinamide riboside transporter PnuC [Marinilabiliales bacterium]